MKRLSAIVATVILPVAQTAFAGEEPAGTEKQFMKNIRPLTYQGKRAGEGYFSNDGKYLIFQDEREADNPFYQIYMLDLESGETHRVSPGRGKTTCAFFEPNGEGVIFASTHRDPQAKKKQKAEFEFRASGQKREFAGQRITNIYDYTYALGAVKIGEPIEVVVLRGDERITLTVIPEARK
ncbi:MAG: hypothetical protein V3V49_10000 [Candidatus Krumholzibacteria bacterium]